MCGKLIYSLYGARDAASNWEREYTNCLVQAGFSQGGSTPCAFYHAEKDVLIVVHGDDFTVLGTDEAIQWTAAVLGARYSIKVRGILGPGIHDKHEITILNRVLRWTDKGLEYEADPRHAEIIVSE